MRVDGIQKPPCDERDLRGYPSTIGASARSRRQYRRDRAVGSGARFVDDLQLGKLGETFLGELGADPRLLGAAERDMRGHVEVLVDPDRAGLDAARDLVGAHGVR